jgi:hypothetical protein
MSPLFTFFFEKTTSATSVSYRSIVSNAGNLTENWSCWIHPCYKVASHGFRVKQDHGLKSFIKTSPVLSNDCPACFELWWMGHLRRIDRIFPRVWWYHLAVSISPAGASNKWRVLAARRVGISNAAIVVPRKGIRSICFRLNGEKASNLLDL